MSIDLHNHVIPRAVLDMVGSDAAYGVRITDGVWWSRNIGEFPLVDAWHDPEAKLREMDSKELDQAVLSVAPKPLYYYELDLDKQRQMAVVANQGMADFCAGQEDRLRWMAHVPLAFPEEAAQVLEQAVEMGAVGAQIGSTAAGQRFDDPVFDVFWDKVEALGVPLFLHPAYESEGPEHDKYALGVVQGMLIEVTNALQRLICGHVLDRHPKLVIVAALAGGFFPYAEGRLRHYSSFRPELVDAPKDPWSYVGQIKFDSHTHDPQTLRFLIDKAGAENVVIGTDCSFQSCTPAPMRELREALQGDTATLEQVATTNARALFWR